MLKRTLLLLGLTATAAAVYFFVAGRQATPPSGSVSAATAPNVATANAAATVSKANVSATAAATNSPEFNMAINPYAGALREPGKSKRAWDAGFLQTLGNVSEGQPISFELTGGKMAPGTIQIVQRQNGEVTYVSGELTAPEAGKFFFLKPPELGKAGKAVGVIEFPASNVAYRIEPTGSNGDPELWQRRMDEVICQAMPLANGAADTNETANIPPLLPGAVPDNVPSYNSNIVSLQSYPGSSAVLLLDFFGGTTTTWGGATWQKPNVSNAQIKDLWKRVAEDYMPFNINVTTDIKVFQAAPATSKQRCVFTPATPALPSGAAGVAYIGSWNWGSDTVCWSIYSTGKNGGEVGAHEPGHTLGLGHQGTDVGTTHTEYYTGQGSGVTGWCPIMGAGYYQPVTTFSKGEYANASNTGDALATITTQNNNVRYRVADTGSTLATARYLEIYPDSSAFAEGVVERVDDVNAFRFTTTGGQVALLAKPVGGDWANLAVSATLYDDADNILATDDPQNVLYAKVNTFVGPGTYTLRVQGSGRNDPGTTGFSSYTSHGYFSVVGFVENAVQPTRLSVVERSPVGTTVGQVDPASPGDALTYQIVSGNTSSTFTIDNNGLLTVANGALLDFGRLSTNSMYLVGFELGVNITDLTNPDLTETNRRVVVSLLATNRNYPLDFSGFNARVIAPYNATTTAPGATGFDIANNYSFYGAGMFGNAQVAGTGGLQGMPPGGKFLSQYDGTTFQFGTYGGTNALMLGNVYPITGTLTLSNPAAFNSLAILGASANGGGLGTVILNYTNGTHSQALSLNAQDWFNTTTNVGLQGFGRLKLGQATLTTEDPGWNNPNLYQTTLNLANLGINQTIASISITKPSIGGSHDAGILALSGSVMPPQVVITQQPQSVTNNNPASGATLYVVAMGAPSLGYQWYSGTPANPTLLGGQTATNLTFSPVSTNQAGTYFVVVSNAINTVTSTVATLTVFAAPQITQQPTPTNLWVVFGQPARFFAKGLGAVPLTYYWQQDGATVSVGTSSNYTIGSATTNHSGNYSFILSNAFGTVTSAVATLSVQPPLTYPLGQRILADKPIGYWRLDETNGVVAHDYVAGNHGTFSGTLLGQPGYSLIDTHKAVRFGTVSQNSYVGNVPIDFTTNGNAQFSIETWVNGSTPTNDAGIITKGTGAGGEQFNLDCGGTGHAFRFFVRDATGTARLASGTIVPGSVWHHVVGVCDEANGRVVLYVDGVSNATGTISANAGLMSSTRPVTFGSRQSGAAGYDLQFRGFMQETAIYNFALTPAQVLTHYSLAANRGPVFNQNPITFADVNAGQNFSASVATNATDPNGDALTFAKVSGPNWLNVSASGALSGTPADADAGTNAFVLSVRDPSSVTTTANAYIYVNGTPSFSQKPINLAPVAPNVAYSASLTNFASDPNPGDVLSFAKLTGPAWLSLAGDGTLSGLPADSDAGTNSFTVQVTDAAGLSDSTTLYIPIIAAPTFKAGITFQNGMIVIDWPAGSGTFIIQSATNLTNPVWETIAGPTTDTTLTLAPTNDAAFFRVLAQ